MVIGLGRPSPGFGLLCMYMYAYGAQYSPALETQVAGWLHGGGVRVWAYERAVRVSWHWWHIHGRLAFRKAE